MFIIKQYYASKSYAKCLSKFAERYPHVPIPSKSAILRVITNFEQTTSVQNLKHNRRRNVLTPERLGKIRTAFQKNWSTSTRKVSTQMNTSQWSIVHATKLLNLHPYRINMVQELLLTDSLKRITFCNWLLRQFKNNVQHLDYVFFSDEAWFIL